MDQSAGWVEGRTGDMRKAVVAGNYVPAFALVVGYWSSEFVVWVASEVVLEKILAFGVDELWLELVHSKIPIDGCSR